MPSSWVSITLSITIFPVSSVWQGLARYHIFSASSKRLIVLMWPWMTTFCGVWDSIVATGWKEKIEKWYQHRMVERSKWNNLLKSATSLPWLFPNPSSNNAAIFMTACVLFVFCLLTLLWLGAESSAAVIAAHLSSRASCVEAAFFYASIVPARCLLWTSIYNHIKTIYGLYGK